MTFSTYNLRLTDAVGITSFGILDDYIQCDLARNVNVPGALTLRLPPHYPAYLFRRDNRLAVERGVNGGKPTLHLETYWYIRKSRIVIGADGREQWEIRALDSMSLLQRRIAAYAAGSSQVDKAGPADNLMKAIVNENFSAGATDASRRISAEYLTIQPDLSLAQSIDKSFVRRNVLIVLQELAQSSTQLGTYLAFDLVPVSERQLEFRTYVGQRGRDRRPTASVGGPLIGTSYGNIRNAVREEDATNERTFVYAGGQGEAEERVIRTAADNGRIGLSPFGRIEYFRDARHQTDADEVQDEAEASLREGRPRILVSGDFVDTPQVTYGVDINYGDIVRVEDRNGSYDARIDTVHLSFNQETGETVQLQLRSDTV